MQNTINNIGYKKNYDQTEENNLKPDKRERDVMSYKGLKALIAENRQAWKLGLGGNSFTSKTRLIDQSGPFKNRSWLFHPRLITTPRIATLYIEGT